MRHARLGLVYYIASTFDGYIAHKDGALDVFPWDDQYGADLFDMFPETFPAHLRSDNGKRSDNTYFDVVLMGRKTYEIGLQEGITNPYPTLDQYVFSSLLRESPDKDIKLITENAVHTVKTLK